jgi:predicted phosphodiesterase
MRIAVIADIHGNALALDAVLADLERLRPDLIVELGDSVSGPLRPRETFERLAALGAPAVRGNHDRWLATRARGALGDWDLQAYDELTPAQRSVLGERPLNRVVAPGVLAVHATPTRDDIYLLDEVDGGRIVRAGPDSIRSRLGQVEARLVLCAHSHRADLVHLAGGPIILNPGSVGCPAFNSTSGIAEAGSPDARYAIVEIMPGGEFRFEQIALPYDHEAAARLAEANGRPEWAFALRTGFAFPSS